MLMRRLREQNNDDMPAGVQTQMSNEDRAEGIQSWPFGQSS